MGEVEKTIGQILVSNLSLTLLVALFILSSLFKIVKKEIDPLGALMTWIGRKITKNVREDVATLKSDTEEQFKTIKKDRASKVDELKHDYNKQIKELRDDLDGFEKRTDSSINEMKAGTAKNCEELKKRMNEMEAAQQKSNDMQTIQTIRAHILDFANSCFNKRKHTKREFENIIDENSRYEQLIEKYEIKNNVYKEDYEFIIKVYHKCQEEGSFLQESDDA